MKKGFKRQTSMDMFIVRSPKKSPAPSPTKDRPVVRQATLESLRGVVVVEDMERAVVVLERLDVSPELKIDTLQYLLTKNPAKEVLIRTGLGKTVHKLCCDKNAEVAAAAQKVYRAWKKHILSKVNRPCIEVKTDLRTQRLRNSARQMLMDALQREDGGGEGGDDKRRDSSDGLKRDAELSDNNRGRESSDTLQRVDKKEEDNDKGSRGSSEEDARIRDRIVYEVFKSYRNRDRQKEDKEGRSKGTKQHKRTEEDSKRREKRKEREEEEEGRTETSQKRKRQEGEKKEEEEAKEKSKEKHKHKTDREKSEKQKDEKEEESKEGRERQPKSKKSEKEERRRDREKHREKNPVQTSSKEEEKGSEREGETAKTNHSSSEKKSSERGGERTHKTQKLDRNKKTKETEKSEEGNPVSDDPKDSTSARHDPVEMIAEHIEREVYHGSQRLVDNAYRRTVRALVFTLRHQAEVRRTVSSATLSVPEFVKQYRKS